MSDQVGTTDQPHPSPGYLVALIRQKKVLTFYTEET